MTKKQRSELSTQCSTPPANDIYAIIIQEENRYRQKGYGLISASAIALSFFYFAPKLAQQVWPVLLEFMQVYQIEKWQAFFTLSWGFNVIFCLLANLVMWSIYHAEHPFFERYKVNSELWPWKGNKQEWDILLRKSLLLVSFNMLVVIPSVFLMTIYTKNWDIDFSFDVEKIPDSLTLFASIVFFMICEDITFHFAHRFVHWKAIYPYIHKVHHTHKVTIGIAAEYTHPLEFMISAILPGAIGPLLLGPHCHLFTSLMWVIVRQGETLDGHSGYEFSWSPYRLVPFSASAQYHDFHHSHNIGNFSSFFSFWDTICGTNKAYYSYYAKKNEARKLGNQKKEAFGKELSAKLEKEQLLKQD